MLGKPAATVHLADVAASAMLHLGVSVRGKVGGGTIAQRLEQAEKDVEALYQLSEQRRQQTAELAGTVANNRAEIRQELQDLKDELAQRDQR